MRWSRFQRIALIAFCAVELLVFVGAFVRATGSGLGCPDWPFCYGCWVPPTRVEQIDFNRLNLEKFRQKAERCGRDPSTITPESIRAEFDPVATWVEYVNRLTSLPVTLSVLAMFIAAFGQARQGRRSVLIASMAGVFVLFFNAWLGARVVFSGLKPGTITLHMALAIVLLGLIVFAGWRGTEKPWRLPLAGPSLGRLRRLVAVLLILVVVEGVMGSQVRELTDELARTHVGQPRSLWVDELEHSWVYLVHRSFSWVIVGLAIAFVLQARKAFPGRVRWLEWTISGLVMAQMILGIVLARVGILAVAQILHIGLSSLLVSALVLWLLGAGQAAKEDAPVGEGAA